MDGLIQWVTGHVDVLLPLVVAIASLLTAVLPQGTPGGAWDLLRRGLNWLALNKGNARNIDTNTGP
ncbi:MAG: hypothetical protein ACE5FA_01090 [Dehalococcoidia bacterium]